MQHTQNIAIKEGLLISFRESPFNTPIPGHGEKQS